MNHKLVRIIGIIALAIFILSFSVVVVINSHFLYSLYIRQTDLMTEVGESYERLMFVYKELMHYLSPFTSSPLLIEGVKMSKEGIIHFKDVKDIFNLFYLLLLISSITMITYIVYFKKTVLELVKPVSKVMIIIPVVLGLLMAIDFNRVFILFHQIAFRNDLWVFDPYYDPIIMFLPESFFMLMGVMIVVLILIMVGILWGFKRKFSH